MRDISPKKVGRHGEPEPPGLGWFRFVVVLALGTSLIITWPLWQDRATPPLLPAIPLPLIDFGPPLLGATLGVLVRPGPGVFVLASLLVVAMLGDQTRMQPEFISLPLLLLGTMPNDGMRLIARAHLVSMWFFAGFHKLVYTLFEGAGSQSILASFIVSIPENVTSDIVVAVAVVEIGTAMFALVPQTRRFAAWSAMLLHSGILIALMLSDGQKNVAVWPWNIALALSGFALIAPWKMSLQVERIVAPRWATIAALILALLPAGYYLGAVDAYPAHHLYSGATTRATIYCPAGCRPEQDLNSTWYAFNVPLPPEPRLFQGFFAATCSPGDVLRITEAKLLPGTQHWTQRVLSCPGGSLAPAH